jgi:hypothetical protein
MSDALDSVDAPSADPVADPTGYRQLVLSYLGQDDPAGVQAGTADLFAQLLDQAGSDLRVRPERGEWSVLEVLAHVVDAEVVAAARYRWILAHDEPPLAPFDQDRWVERLHGNRADPAALMELFRALRTANLRLWSESSEAERSRIGLHQERGPESFDLTFRLAAGHGRLHHEQASRTIDRIRSAR